MYEGMNRIVTTICYKVQVIGYQVIGYSTCVILTLPT